MPDIYEQHAAAFRHVSAFLVLYKGERVASVAIKYPRDGAGRLWAYTHWYGTDMVRGFAGGYGYDKASAAVEKTARAMAKRKKDPAKRPHSGDDLHAYLLFLAVLERTGGTRWDDALRRAGFTVHQAV
jgi:hypothetical protein